jgi:hypothetical protein
VRLTREVLERPVRDHVDLGGRHPEPVDELGAAVLRMRHECVNRVVEPALGRGLTGPGLTRQDVVRGQHGWAGGEQPPVEPLDVEPLEVDHVCLSLRRPSVAEHVRQVLEQL